MLKIGQTENSMWTARYMTGYKDYAHLQTKDQMERYRRIALGNGGEGGSFIKSMRDGEFGAEEDEQNVFTELDLTRVREAMRRPGELVRRGKKRIGFDVSVTSSGDPKVLYVMDGLYVYPAFVSREEDTTKVAQWAVAIALRYGVNPRDFYVDAGGAGKPVVDIIETIFKYRPVVRYMNNQSARFREEYEDRITEDHWRVKQILHEYELSIPDDTTLYAQMRFRRCVEGRHEKIKLQSKKDHRKEFGESPDNLDAFVMMLADFESPYKGMQQAPDIEVKKTGGLWRPPSPTANLNVTGGPMCGMIKQMSMAELTKKMKG